MTPKNGDLLKIVQIKTGGCGFFFCIFPTRINKKNDTKIYLFLIYINISKLDQPLYHGKFF